MVSIFLFLFTSHHVFSQTEITFWTTQVDTQSIKIQENLAAKFQARHPSINIRIVPVDQSELPEKVNLAKLTQALPDVILHPLIYTFGWIKEGIIDQQAATEIIESLGKETFYATTLNFVSVNGGYAAVPVDGWGEFLIYRKDLLGEKGITRPDDWESIKKVAQMTHNPPLLWGFEVPTAPESIHTQQVLENFALSNNVHLIHPETGQVNLNTPQFIATLRFYKNLSRFTPSGNVDWIHTKIDYLAGRCVMMVGPSTILGELVGLKIENPVLVKELHQKTGFIGIIKGPEGKAQYGRINCLSITSSDKVEEAKNWVKYLLDDGYLSWLGMMAEGRFPARRGTREKPEKFIEDWRNLNFSGTESAISEYYQTPVLNSILSTVGNFHRWGLKSDKGELIMRMYQLRIIPQVLKRYLDGDIFTAEKTASLINDLVREIENIVNR